MKSRPSSERCRRTNRAALAVLCLMLSLGLTPIESASLPHVFSYFGVDLSRLEEMAGRYDAVIWHNHPKVRQALPELKRRKPSLEAFMYRELFCVLKDETPLAESVGHYEWIETHHPDWFQRDTHGNRIEVPDYPGRWMMNLGHPGWQAFWIEQTLQEVVAGGWDGAFADDALTSVTAHRLPPLAGYPDDASLQQAVLQFLARAADAFHHAGKLFVANVSDSYDYPGLWERWLAVTDGLMEEHFAGVGWTWGPDVARRQLEAMRLAAEQGKRMFCLTYGSWEERQRMMSSLSAYLLGAQSRIYWSYRPDEHSDDPAWDPSWITTLGEPIGTVEVDGSVWQRRFEQGVVAANVGDSPSSLAFAQGHVVLQPHQAIVIKNPPLRAAEAQPAWPMTRVDATTP